MNKNITYEYYWLNVIVNESVIWLKIKTFRINLKWITSINLRN